jgi:hypothetical protein
VPILVVEGTRFNCVNLLFCGSRAGGQFSLFATRGRLSLHLLFANLACYFVSYKGLSSSWLFLNFLVLTSNNLVECALAQPKVSFFCSRKQPKNLESVINLKILLWHVLRMLHYNRLNYKTLKNHPIVNQCLVLMCMQLEKNVKVIDMT